MIVAVNRVAILLLPDLIYNWIHYWFHNLFVSLANVLSCFVQLFGELWSADLSLSATGSNNLLVLTIIVKVAFSLFLVWKLAPWQLL